MRSGLPIIALFIFFSGSATAQDTAFARRAIDRLCAADFAGRGYVNEGSRKAARWIRSSMDSAGCSKTGLQTFMFPANAITSVKLSIGGRELVPGRDYLAGAHSGSRSVQGKIRYVITGKTLVDSLKFRKTLKKIIAKCGPVTNGFCLIDTLPSNLKKKFKKELELISRYCNVILVNTKLTYTVATETGPAAYLELTPRALEGIKRAGAEVRLNLQSDLRNHEEYNVIGSIAGSAVPDSSIVICAHYDHLGMMGSAVFPGANDNAAGVAMLLDLARYYAAHPHRYTVVFIAFAGEEAGLFGSRHYVENPRHPLSKTRFVLNLDLVGTGETGMTVVNANTFPRDFSMLDSINRASAYLPEIRRRGKAANSDHHFFTEAGIPSFFWYQSGPRSAYHDVDDIPSTLSLAGYNGTFRLAVEFLNTLR